MMGSTTTSTRDLEQVGQKLFEPNFFGGVHAGNYDEDGRVRSEAIFVFYQPRGGAFQHL